MKKQINWKLFNQIKNLQEKSLCAGEEKTLSEAEIDRINNNLQIMASCAEENRTLFDFAVKRFGKF